MSATKLSWILFFLLVVVGVAIPFRHTLDETLIVKGDVLGGASDGTGQLAFHFYDQQSGKRIHQTLGNVEIRNGEFQANVPIEPIKDAGEVLMAITTPETSLGDSVEMAAPMLPLIPVWLQSATPGTQQIGHANISGTLIAGAIQSGAIQTGAIQTGAFRLTAGAGAGRVLTSDASGSGSWQNPPPPSGPAGGDLSGTYPTPLVDGLQGRAVAPTAPTRDQVLKWDGAAWAPAADLTDQLWQASGSNIYYNAGNVGIGTNSPAYPLHVETGSGDRAIYVLHTATSGLVYSVFAQSDANGGRGVVGYASATSGTTYGVNGVSDSNSGRGVVGYASATSGTTYGVYGVSDSNSGKGVYGLASETIGTTYGVFGESVSTSGTGVHGRAIANSGITFGVSGRSSSTQGRAVYGYASHTSGNTFGVFAESRSTSGTGVYGIASSTSGSTFGVYGHINSSQSGAYGVLGTEPTGGAGHAVYAIGTLAATGTKSFQIDHPLDPENYYLNHFCTEGPEPYNTYRGNVVTDAKGYATIALPAYFDSINRDPTYHLTVIDDSDDFILAKVVREIRNNEFTIRTSKPYVKVSWEVKAIRHDRWVQRYGFQTDQEKEDEIKGKYLNPELYGKPKESGILYRPDMGQMPVADRRTPARATQAQQTNGRAKAKR